MFICVTKAEDATAYEKKIFVNITDISHFSDVGEKGKSKAVLTLRGGGKTFYLNESAGIIMEKIYQARVNYKKGLRSDE